MMDIETLYALQLSWIHWIHEFRNPFLDRFFLMLNFFDRNEFFILLISAIWYFISPKWGLRIFFLMLANSLINSSLKAVFELPRPFHLDASLEILNLPTYGFPSGVAQTAVILPLILNNEWKNRYAIIIGTLFFILLSFSSVYLSVHFVTDLIGGWIVGFLLTLLFYQLAPRIETAIKKYPSSYLLFGYLATIILFIFLAPTLPTIKIAFTAIGAGIGLFYIEDLLPSYPRVNTFKEKLSLTLTNTIVLYMISYLGMGVIADLLPHYKLVTVAMTALMIGFFATAILPLLFFYLNKVRA